MDGNTVVSNVVALHKKDLLEIITEALELGKKQAAILNGDEPPFMSQNKAWDVYKRANVERWLEQGIIRRYFDYGDGVEGTYYRYSVMELIAASLSNNYIKKLSEEEKAEYRKAIPITSYIK